MRKAIIIISLFIGIQHISLSQSAFLSVEKDSVQLGEPFQVTLNLSNVDVSKITSIDWRHLESFQCAVNDTLFADMDIEMADTGQFKGLNPYWRKEAISFEDSKNTFTLIAWEHYDCPLDGPIIYMADASIIRSGTLPMIHLKSPLNTALENLVLGNRITAIIDSSELEKAPIYDNIAYIKTWKDYLYIVAWVLGLGILAWLLYRFFNKNKNQELEEVAAEILPPEPVIPPHIVALEKLQNLKEQKAWQHEDDKIFISELTNTLRGYVEGRYDIQALEMTTQEIISKLNNSHSADQISTLRNTLNVADLIKFAKAKADESTYEKFVDDAIHWVHSTKLEKVEDS